MTAPAGPSRERWDVVVVGAGPAGAVAAREMARWGLAVLLVDRDSFPRWKVCGGCLSGPGQAALGRAGLESVPGAVAARPLDRLRVRGWGRSVGLALDGPVAVSRASLDHALVEAAGAAGVEVRTGWSAALGGATGRGREVQLRSGAHEVRVSTALVVVATGLGPLRRLSGAGPAPDAAVVRGSRVGVGALFGAGALPTVAVPPGTVEMAVADEGYVGLVRLADGRIDVAGALDPACLRRPGGPGAVVASIMDGAGLGRFREDPVEGWRGTPPLTRAPGPVEAPDVFRVGDAAGYVEPFTGEGMGWALASAVALAPLAVEAVEGGRAAAARAWARIHRRTVGRRQRICRGVAWISRRPAVARAVLGVLGSRPWAAAPFIRDAAGLPAREEPA